MVEINKTSIYLCILGVLLWIRNVFFSNLVLSSYPLYPFRMNGNFTRCSNAYFAAKGTKPLKRMLFFNLMRCMIPEILKELIFKGRIVLWEFGFVLCCTIVYTIFFHFLPLKYWRYYRYIWAWQLMEYYTKHASDLIGNRNDLDSLQNHNFCAFLLFLYLESNSMLTAAMTEGLLHWEIGVMDLPYMVYDGAYNYIIAIPLCYVLQVYLLSAPLQLDLSDTVSGFWWQKRHLSGWMHVNHLSEQYDGHWFYCAIMTALFICLSGRLDVYRRIKWMEDYAVDGV